MASATKSKPKPKAKPKAKPKPASKKKKASFDKTAYQREYQANAAAANRDIVIRKCKDRKRRNRCLKDPVLFLKTYFPDRFFRPFSDDQIEAIGIIVETAKFGGDEMICAPRGDWKTETTKHMMIYLMLKRIIRFPLLFGATGESAGANFEHIKHQFESELLSEDFPEVCDPIIALGGSPQKAKRMTHNGQSLEFEWGSKVCCFPVVHKVPGTGKPSLYNGMKMTYRGIESHIRGINVRGYRPDIALGDDLETRESANSDGPEGQIATREQILDKDIGGLAGGGESLTRIVIGTVQNSICLTYKKLKQWGGKRYQAVKAWPTNPRGIELWEEYIEIAIAEKAAGKKDYPKAHALFLKNFDVMIEGVVLGNPHNYSRKKRRNGKPMEVHGIQRVYNLVARHTQDGKSGWDYVLTELQNEPPKAKEIETTGLTYSKVMSRISGFKQREIPPDTLFVTAAMDLGKYKCHWEIVAWLNGLVGVTINYGAADVIGLGTQSDQAHVDMAIRSTLHQWRNELVGLQHCPVMPDNILIDSGTPIQGKRGTGEHAEVVYGFVKEVQDGTSTFKASKGLSPYGIYTDIKGKRIVGKHWHANKQAEHGVWLYNLDSDWLKLQTQQMWLTPTFDAAQQFNPMSASLFSVVDEDGKPDTRRHSVYANHQVAEEYRQQFEDGPKGGLKKWWHKINSNNHWLDTRYMNLAAALQLGAWMPLDKTPQPALPPKPTKKNSGRGNSRFARNGKSFVARRN